MKISVLLFQPDPETDSVLADALGAAGFRVCRKKTLSGLHNQLSSRDFDAVLVGQATLALYGVVPARHLWENASPINIMSYSLHDGTCSVSSHAVNRKDTGILSRIESVVREAFKAPESRSLSQTTPDSSVRPGFPVSGPVFDIPLQKKPAAVLDSLVKAGIYGADIRDIAKNCWGSDNPDRKKDIQIYMTRLRHALDTAFPRQYRIRLEGTRYILTDAKM